MWTSIKPVSALILNDRIRKFSPLSYRKPYAFWHAHVWGRGFFKSPIVCSVCPPDGQRAQLTYRVVLTSRWVDCFWAQVTDYTIQPSMLWKYLILTKNSMFWLKISTFSSVTPSGLLNFLFLTALSFCLWGLCPLFDIFRKEREVFVEASICRMLITEAGWLICWNLGVKN